MGAGLHYPGNEYVLVDNVRLAFGLLMLTLLFVLLEIERVGKQKRRKKIDRS